SWSASGRDLAVSTVAHRAKGGGIARVVVLAVGSPRAHVVASSRAYGFEMAGWWPDGNGLLYWRDEGFSASIAADGLPLVSQDLSSGRTHVLATTLPYSEWLAWAPDRRTLAVVVGPDRVVWNGAKRVALCHVVSGTCRPEPQPNGSTSIDPAWSDHGRLYFARSTGSAAYSMGPPPRIHGLAPRQSFSWEASEAWAAAGTLEAVRAKDGAQRPPRAVGGASGGQAPTPAGANLLFVRSGALWLLRGGSSVPTELAGGLGTYGPAEPGYYGYIAWHDTFAWHA
ncbi:MAG: hypothetical protein ACRDXC_12610, partial [Acidimicrobiales bacterium]